MEVCAWQIYMGDLCDSWKWEWVGSERGCIEGMKVVCAEWVYVSGWDTWTWWTLGEWILSLWECEC